MTRRQTTEKATEKTVLESEIVKEKNFEKTEALKTLRNDITAAYFLLHQRVPTGNIFVQIVLQRNIF